MLDISEQQPLSAVACPVCGESQRVLVVFNNFELEEVLGAGGMGAVYKARDLNLDRPVAFKLLRKEHSNNAAFIAKFEREARITASISHPHVVKVYSFGSDHGLYYIAMELVDKGSLDDLMSLQGKVAEVQALGVGLQIAQGLQAAHEAGLIHRDVKPGNILFAEANSAKIVDFGLALLMEQEAEARGEVWGTPYYVAPEKLDHQPEDFRSDIYSLGGTLFHAMAGRPPFEADNASMVALKHLKSRAVSLQAFAPDVSSPTAFVINRMLEKEPENRYQSYAELIEHLSYARHQLEEAAQMPRAPRQRVVVESQAQRQLASGMAVIGILLILGLGAAYFLTHDQSKGSATTAVGASAMANNRRAEASYIQARRALLAGETESAAVGFQALGDDPETPEPIRSWSLWHRGMIALLNDQEPVARTIFGRLEEITTHASTGLTPELARFFHEASEAMSGKMAIHASAVVKAEATNGSALAWLLDALKDWQLMQFAEAVPLFDAYLAAKPAGDWGWIADYHAIAARYAEAARSWLVLELQASKAVTPEERAAALSAMEEWRGRVQPEGKLAERVEAVERQLKAGN